MPAKKNQQFSLESKQFASLMQEVAGQLPAGVQLDASVMAALQTATNTHFNELAQKRTKKKVVKKEKTEKAEAEDTEMEPSTSA